MTQTFQSWLDFTVSEKISPADTTIYISPVPTITAGRVYLKNAAQEEWISFTWVGATSITGCTRWLSQTADPATSGTGLTWVAWSKGVLVAMHDQLPDKQQGDAVLFSAKVYATTAARDSALWANWAATKAYTGIYVTATGLFYNYNLSTAQWESVDTGTTTPDATTTAAGKVELPTDAEVTSGTATGGTWATLTPTNAQTIKSVSLKAAWTTISTADEFVINQSAVDKRVTGTLTRQFTNSTEITAWENLTAGDLVSVYTDGSVWKSIKSATAAAQLSTITGLDTGNRPVQTIYLSIDKCVVFYQKSADNIIYARVVTFAQRTPTVWTEQAVSSALAVDGMFAPIALSNSLFVVWFNKSTGDKAYAVACTVSWTTITAGTEVDMSDGTTCSGSTGVSIGKITASKFVMGRLWTVSADCTINAWSISWTTITAGTSNAMEATTSTWIALPVYIQDDVVWVFYDDGTNISFKVVEYSGTTGTLNSGVDTVAGSLRNDNARAIYVDWWRCQCWYNWGSWLLRVISINVADRSARTTPYFDATCNNVIYTDNVSDDGAMDISLIGTRTVALVNQIDGLNDVRLRILNVLYDWFETIVDTTIATTMVKVWCCQLTGSSDKIMIAFSVWAGLYYSVYRDNSQNFAGVVKTTTSAAANVPIIRSGDAAIAGLTAWLAYYVWDAGAVATTGTKRIGVATSTTNLFLN